MSVLPFGPRQPSQTERAAQHNSALREARKRGRAKKSFSIVNPAAWRLTASVWGARGHPTHLQAHNRARGAAF